VIARSTSASVTIRLSPKLGHVTESRTLDLARDRSFDNPETEQAISRRVLRGAPTTTGALAYDEQVRLAGVIAVLAACYSPASYRDCEISCAASGVCPDGFTCDPTDGMCRSPGSDTCSDVPPPDEMVDTCVDLTLLGIKYCPPAPVAALRVLDLSGSFDTDGAGCSDVLLQADGQAVCVVAGTSVRVAAEIQPKGTRPLLIVALDALIVERKIDVSQGGAGDVLESSTSLRCEIGIANQGIAGTTGSGGGGGGGFAGPGGRGGAIIGGQPTAAGSQVATPVILRAGCPGGESGGDNDGIARAPGGRPGGGVYLAAGRQLRVGGDIHAFGGGGLGTTVPLVGGGGGASGGMIVLDAPMVAIGVGVALLAAGGGGGEGKNTTAVMSQTGGTQNPATPGMPAPGGVGPGGDGGSGSGGLAVTMHGELAEVDQGAGGGGGGAGYILVFAKTLVNNGVSVPPFVP
jgi:hypothetical protein